MPEVSEFVYYREQDYARVIRRIPSMLIDLVVVVLMIFVVAGAAQALYVPRSILEQPRSAERDRQWRQHWRPIQKQTLLVCAASAVAYHILLRRTRGGTLGYRLLGIRLIDATGQPPTWKTIVRRFLISVPLFMLLAATYWGCFQNPRRQALHDTFAGTWVVRKNAQAAGPARPAYQTKLVGTWPVTYLDLEPIGTNAPTADRA